MTDQQLHLIFEFIKFLLAREGELSSRLDSVNVKLAEILAQGVTITMSLVSLQSLLGEIRIDVQAVATNQEETAADIDRIIASLPTEGGMTAEEVATFTAELSGFRDAFKTTVAQSRALADKIPPASSPGGENS